MELQKNSLSPNLLYVYLSILVRSLCSILCWWKRRWNRLPVFFYKFELGGSWCWMLKSPTINSFFSHLNKLFYIWWPFYGKFSYLNPFLRDGGGLYTTTSLVESLFTLIIQSNSSNWAMSCVCTMFRNETAFFK